MPLSRCLHFSHDIGSPFLLPTAACALQLCAYPLFLLSNCPKFCTIHHGRFYSRRVHFVFQLCWYVPVAHHPNSFLSSTFDQAIFPVLFTSFWAPSLTLNNEPIYLNCLHFFFLNVDRLIFFWAWHVFCFSVRGTQMSLSISLAATQLLLYYDQVIRKQHHPWWLLSDICL